MNGSPDCAFWRISKVYVVIDKALAVGEHQDAAKRERSAPKQARSRHEPTTAMETASAKTAATLPVGPLRQPNLQKARYVEGILAEARKNRSASGRSCLAV